ncbi:MAG: hypothetical protein WCE30_07445 [Mycobacterium sp.]
MSSSPQIRNRTRMFARVLGPYLLIAAVTLVARPSYASALVRGFEANTVWPWITGAFVLPMGLVVIALHPYWRGAAAATISTLGWMTVFKGVALMTFPRTYLLTGQDAVGAAPWWQISVIIMVLVGLYLTIVGWIPNRRTAESGTAAADAL